MAKYKELDDYFPLGVEQRTFYMENPVAFVEDFILTNEGEYLSEPQKEILRDLVFNKRVTVSSGRGLGKSCVSAWAIIWFMLCFRDVKVGLISPSRQQLESVLYTELRKWLKRSPFYDSFVLNKGRMYYKGDTGHFCELVVARKDNPEAVSGRHEENMLFVVDEASNVHDVTLNYLSDSLTDVNNHLLCLSNPTRTQGFFYDTHHERTGSGKARVRKRWIAKIYSALSSPFVDSEDIERIRAYGEHSDQWRVSVLGQFPAGSPEAFIQMEQVEKAVSNEIEFPSGPLRIGVDVAGSGTDLAVLAKSIGYKLYPLERKQRTDRADEYITWVSEACTELRSVSGRPNETVIVKVDDGGVGGHFVASALQEKAQELNIDVRPTTFGGSRDKNYYNNTARMFDHLKKIIHLMDMPNDRDMVEELSSRKYKVDFSAGQETSQIKMQTKDEYRREFGKSPDSGDAVLLCMFDSKNPRTVLKDFNPSDRNVVVNKLNYVGGMDQYISLFYSSDGQASTVWASWDGKDLILTRELITDDNLARVASEIKHFAGDNTVKIIGNNRCFGKHSQDVKSQIRKYGVRLKENRKYDELGAISFLNDLLAEKRLKVYNKLENAPTQLSEWRKDTSLTKQQLDFGLCFSLLNITSELKQRVEKESKRTAVRRPYSENKTFGAKNWEKAFGW